MKLIDVDNFLKQYADQVRGYTIGTIDSRLALLKEWVLVELLANAPTVEAIPIEWIEKYIENHTYEMVNPKYVDDTYNYIKFTEKPLDYNLTVMPIQVKAMLTEWEEENETN